MDMGDLDVLRGFETKRSVTPWEKHFLIQEITTNSSFKGCILDENIASLVRRNDLKANITWDILPEQVISFHYAFAFFSHHFLFPIFNEKIEQLINGGFIDFWMKHLTKTRWILEKPDPPEPVVLTMNHLEIGFQIWLICLLASFVIFLGETSSRGFVYLKKLASKFMSSYIVTKYYDVVNSRG